MLTSSCIEYYLTTRTRSKQTEATGGVGGGGSEYGGDDPVLSFPVADLLYYTRTEGRRAGIVLSSSGPCFCWCPKESGAKRVVSTAIRASIVSVCPSFAGMSADHDDLIASTIASGKSAHRKSR